MNILDIFDIIQYVFFSFIFIPIGVAIYRWRYLATSDKLVFYFLSGYLIIRIISIILRFNQTRNHFLYYFRTMLIVWFSYFLYTSTVKCKVNYYQKILLFSCIGISLAMLIEIIYLGFNKINTITLTASMVLICCLSVIYIKNKIKHFQNSLLDTKSIFWYQVGNFTFGFFSIFTSLFKNYFIETSLYLYLFFDTLSVMSYAVAFTLYAFGLGITKKT